MEKGSNYRLLKIRELLLAETDEQHELGINEIAEKLRQFIPDKPVDHRTIKRDLEVLDNIDFEIKKNDGRYGKILYTHESRLFQTYQLRLILDVILSARFVTTNENKKLIVPVKQLTSKHIAKPLPQPIRCGESANMDYEQV